MAETLQVVITGKDGVSRIFTEVAKSAQSAGKAIEAAGKEGQTGFKRIGEIAEDAAEGVDKVGESAGRASVDMQALGAAATVVGAGLLKASNDSMRQEQQIIGLTRAYGDAADEMLAFAQEMDDVTMFSDDDIRGGERYFASLKNNYDLSIAQIQELMRVTADLASASGVSFEDASSRVTAAIRGEGEAAEYLGLTMNQQAINRENLTLKMTNQEAAQFRLNALYQQTAQYEGTAADMAASSAGKYADLQDTLQDVGQSVADTIGPLASMGAGLALSASGVSSAVGLFRNFGPAVKASQLAMSGLALATGPVGLGLAAIGIAGYGMYKLLNQGNSDAEQSVQTLTDSYASLGDVISNIRIDGRALEASWLEDYRSDLTAATDAANAFVNDQDAFNAKLSELAETSSQEWFDKGEDLYNAYTLSAEGAERLASASELIGNAFADQGIDARALHTDLDELTAKYNSGELTLDQYAEGIIAISENLDEYAVSVQQAMTSLDGLTDAQREFAIAMDDLRLEGNDELARHLETINSNMLEVGVTSALTAEQADQFAAAQERINDLVASGAVDYEDVNAALTELTVQFMNGSMTAEEYAAAVVAMSQDMSEFADSSDKATGATLRLVDAMDRYNDTADRKSQLMDEINQRAANQETILGGVAAAVSATGVAWDEAAAGAEAYNQMVTANLQALIAVAGYDDPLSSWALSGSASDFAELAFEATQAGNALDNVFRVVVGNTNAWASQAQGVEDWATELINVQGEYGKIDDLRERGRINDEQYASAQRAYNDIVRENAEIQEHVLTIQAMQAPLIRDQLAAQEDYLQAVADLPAQQQLVTLGWMDATEAGRAMEFQTLAVAAATGQLGENGDVAFANMIAGAAQADPVLKGMLIDMGLISEGADGTITVHLSGVSEGKSELEELQLILVGLADLLDDGKLNASVTLETFGVEEAKDAEDVVVGIDGTTATATVNVEVENALRGVAGTGAAGLMDALGLSDTSTTQTVTVDADTSAASMKIFALKMQTDGLATGIGTPVIDADTSAAQTAIDSIESDLDSLDGLTTIVMIDGDAEGAMSAISAASVNLTSINGATGSIFVNGDASGALTAVSDASVNLSMIDGSAAMVYVNGDNSNAVGVIQGTAAYDGMTIATTYVDIVTREVGTKARALGGVVDGYATGGVIVELAENGPEVLHFASGGTAYVGSRGIYSVEPGTYVSPNNAVGNTSYGGITIDFSGAVFNGTSRREMNDWATYDLLPAIAAQAEKWRAGQGAGS